jgi:hypothetical protein
MFPYALLCRHERAKQDTIVVTRRINAKLPHCTGLVLTYPILENKMSFVHHAIEQWGCGSTIKDDKSLNERIQRHLMLKPMSKLM